MTQISIIVLSHNRMDDLRTNLPVLLSGMTPDMELIVVDNASSDGSREFLQGLRGSHPFVTVSLQESNSGVAMGRNTGFRLAKGEYVVCLDDDAAMAVADIRRVPALFAEHGRAGILAFSVRHATTGEKQNDHGDVATSVANFHGAAHAIRAEMFARVGYLDELCSFGGEEFDFSVRCHAAGYLTIYLPDVLALHNSLIRPGPVGLERRERWIYNYVRILHKHFPGRMAALFSIRYTFLMIKWSQCGLNLSILMRFAGAALRGRRDGISVHTSVPAETVRHYSDQSLSPQYGNVPIDLWQMLSRKLKALNKRANHKGTATIAVKNEK